jgi:hypothetical protein
LPFDESELYGRYFFGFYITYHLVIDPDGCFTFRSSDCLGEFDRNAGSWRLTGDTLVLEPERPNTYAGFQGMGVRFIPVKWGERHYLVDENEMPGFCAAAAEGDLPVWDGIHGLDYVKLDGGSLPPAEGMPLIPERFRTFLEDGPVGGTVVRIEASGDVIIDQGTRDRIQVGMLLSLGGWRGGLRVVSAVEHESVARRFYYWNSSESVKAGAGFTSGTYDTRPFGTGYQRFPAPPGRRK